MDDGDTAPPALGVVHCFYMHLLTCIYLILAKFCSLSAS